MARLLPLPGYALVKLGQGKYRNVAAPTKVYESASSGELIGFFPLEEEEVYSDEYKDAIGCTVYWQELNATAPVTTTDGDYSYVKLTDLQGYEHA